VAYPFLPENGHSMEEAAADEIAIDQVMIGSCTMVGSRIYASLPRSSGASESLAVPA